MNIDNPDLPKPCANRLVIHDPPYHSDTHGQPKHPKQQCQQQCIGDPSHSTSQQKAAIPHPIGIDVRLWIDQKVRGLFNRDALHFDHFKRNGNKQKLQRKRKMSQPHQSLFLKLYRASDKFVKQYHYSAPNVSFNQGYQSHSISYVDDDAQLLSRVSNVSLTYPQPNSARQSSSGRTLSPLGKLCERVRPLESSLVD